MTELRFYIGLKEIAKFLGLHHKTCQRKLQAGLIPAKKDLMGRWVLTNHDYYNSLKEASPCVGPSGSRNQN